MVVPLVDFAMPVSEMNKPWVFGFLLILHQGATPLDVGRNKKLRTFQGSENLPGGWGPSSLGSHLTVG